MLAILSQEFGPQLVEQSFEGLAVVQGLPQLWHQLGGDVHTTAAALVGEREKESRMFVAAGASGAVGADAGFADFGQGALDSGPELLELAQEVLAERRIGGFWVRHAVCILYDIRTSQEKNERISDA